MCEISHHYLVTTSLILFCKTSPIGCFKQRIFFYKKTKKFTQMCSMQEDGSKQVGFIWLRTGTSARILWTQ